ncbi:MAG: RAMP superfamily CRISPR-associated protein [Burkholderiales bacterium]
MKEVNVKLRIVTPMFLGGSSGQVAVPLNEKSLKGALRFWWRAVHWPRFRLAQTGIDAEAKALEALRREELRLLGAAATDDTTQPSGQGTVHLRVESGQTTLLRPNLVKAQGEDVAHAALQDAVYEGEGTFQHAFPTRPGHVYLLGLGLAQYYRPPGGVGQNWVVRPAIAPTECEVSLFGKRGVAAEDLKSVLQGLWAMGMLGGLGSRSRRGFGSFSIHEVKTGAGIDSSSFSTFNPPSTPDEYKGCVEALLKASDCKNAIDLAPFTALNKDSQVRLLYDQTRIQLYNGFEPAGWETLSIGGGMSPWQLLDALGEQYLRYRGWGFRGTIAGRTSEMNFKSDHDNYKDCVVTANAAPPVPPERLGLGLPLPYTNKWTVGWTKKPLPGRPRNDEKTLESRRASPLFFHIHQFADKRVCGALTLLPARFLPADAEINAMHSDRNLGRGYSHMAYPLPVGAMSRSSPPLADLWSVGEKFLDRFPGSPKIRGT